MGNGRTASRLVKTNLAMKKSVVIFVAVIGLILFALALSHTGSDQNSLIIRAVPVLQNSNYFSKSFSYQWLGANKLLILRKASRGESVVQLNLSNNQVVDEREISVPLIITDNLSFWSISPDRTKLMFAYPADSATNRVIFNLINGTTKFWFGQPVFKSPVLWFPTSHKSAEIQSHSETEVVCSASQDDSAETSTFLLINRKLKPIGFKFDGNLLVRYGDDAQFQSLNLNKSSVANGYTWVPVPEGCELGLSLISPSGRKLAYLARRTSALPRPSFQFRKPFFHFSHQVILQLWVCNVDGSEPKHLGNIQPNALMYDLQWHPEEKAISFVHGETLWIREIKQ